MRDLHEELEKLRLDAEDCRLISRLATDITKRHAFEQLADRIAGMAVDVEALITTKVAAEATWQ